MLFTTALLKIHTFIIKPFALNADTGIPLMTVPLVPGTSTESFSKIVDALF